MENKMYLQNSEESFQGSLEKKDKTKRGKNKGKVK